MPFTGTFLLSVYILIYQVKCEENTQERVQFTAADAKRPNFKMEAYAHDAIDDLVASESIILPTLNIDSHPFAVVVLPNLRKYSSDEALKLRKLDSENENSSEFSDQREDLDLNAKLRRGGEKIPIFSVRKKKGEVIKLKTISTPYDDSEFDKDTSINFDEIKLRKLPENVENNDSFQIDVINTSRSQQFINDDAKINLTKISKGKKNKNFFKGYPRKEGDLLFSPLQVPIDFEEEVLNEDVLLTDSPSLVEESMQNKEELKIRLKMPPIQIQTLPIVEQFSNAKEITPLFSTQNSLNTNSKSQFIINEIDQDQPFNLLNNRSFEVLQAKEHKNNSGKTAEEENIKNKTNFQRNLAALSTQSNLQTVNQKDVEELPFVFGQTVVPSTLPEIPLKREIKNKLNDDTNSALRSKIHPILLQILNATNSSTSGLNFPASIFEYVTNVGLPIPDIVNQESTSSDESKILPFNFKVSSSEDPSSSEQTDQIKQLIKLRNQLSLLDTAKFLKKNLEKTKRPETQKEQTNESFRNFKEEEENVDDRQKFGKNIDKLNKTLVSASLEKEILGRDFELETPNHPLNESFTNNQEESLDFLLQPKDELVSRDSDERAILNWSNFLNIKNKSTKIKEGILTKNKEIKSNFSSLESVITPIKPIFSTTNPSQKTNQSKTFDNVVFEKFNISDAISTYSRLSKNKNVSNLELPRRNKNQFFFSFDYNYGDDNDAASAISNLNTLSNIKLSQIKERGSPSVIHDTKISPAPTQFNNIQSHGKQMFTFFYVGFL